MKLRHFLLAGTAAAATCLFSSCDSKDEQAASDQVFRISAIPDADTTAQAERFEPLRAYLEKELGVKVEFVASDTYTTSVEKFVNGDIQFGWFGGVTGVQSIEKVEGARAIVAGKKDLAFKSYFVANASTGLKDSADFPTAIRDLQFTFGSPNSTSGRVMPSFYINEETGTYPDEFFTNPVSFTKGHDKVALAVQNGDFQAGVMSFGRYERMVEEGDIDPAVCVKIWETPEYADYNGTAHPALDEMFGEGFVDKLQAVLINCKDEAVLNALNRSELVEINNETLAGIAAVVETLGL